MTDRSLPSAARTLAFVLRIAVRTHPVLAMGALSLVPLSWLTESLGALWLKYLVDGVAGEDVALIVLACVGLVGTRVGGWLADGLGMRLNQTFQDKSGLALEQRMIHVSAGMSGIAHLERPEYLDRLDPLRRETWIVHWTFEALAHGIGAVAQTAFTITLLAAVHPALVALPLFGVPAVLVARWSGRRERNAQEEAGESRRRQQHLIDLGSKASPGKEIRVFGLGDALRRLSRTAWRREHELRVGAAWTDARWNVVATLVMATGFTGALLLVGYGVATDRSTVGDLALVLVLAQVMSGNLGQVVDMARWMFACLAIGARLVWLDDRAIDERGRRAADPVPVPDKLRAGIELRELTFTYPGTDQVVLDHISLTLPAGGVVAIVGENGAGKTTLVKLLGGMYEPTAGAVLVDGVDLRLFDPARWRERCTGAFQDYARFELPLRQAITIGDLSRLDDPAAAERALAAAGADDLLGVGLETQLGATWPGGRELSGGQWQKVALARGLMREAPLLTVLDEPTAALDALTEDTLFRRYAATARRYHEHGGITLLVSHRFSTVRAADHIVVLGDGVVAEQGTHDELLARGGPYAELYHLQARGYS